MSTPRSIRFDEHVLRRLSGWVSAHPGATVSGAVNHFIDEALRMREHPGIVFRDGPAGRRAGLVCGPDVWEVLRVLKDVRAAEPGLHGDALVAEAAESQGLTRLQVRIALDYYGSYHEEIDEFIDHAEHVSETAERAWHAQQRLLA